MSYAEIIARCETDPVFFLGCICWAAFIISAFAAVGWRFGKSLIGLLPRNNWIMSAPPFVRGVGSSQCREAL